MDILSFSLYTFIIICNYLFHIPHKHVLKGLDDDFHSNDIYLEPEIAMKNYMSFSILKFIHKQNIVP